MKFLLPIQPFVDSEAATANLLGTGLLCCRYLGLYDELRNIGFGKLCDSASS